MEHVRLGRSGLRISPVILGFMGFGSPGTGGHSWAAGIDEARPVLRAALDAGITTIDTANVYGLGASEQILGDLLREFAVRDEVIIATKVAGRMGDRAKESGLSRAAILAQADASLRRLGTDYIDLYQIHRLDPDVEIEETMEALHYLVLSGKVRYIGASSMYAWQFAKAQFTADLHGWTRFVSMQDQYNLIMREEEREMHPFCIDQGVGVIPWSPLARGRLSRPSGEETARSSADAFGKTLYHQDEESDQAIIVAVGAVAEARGVPRAQVALAWARQQQAVTAPIVGISREKYLHDAVASVEIRLEAEELELLERPYTPRTPEF